jgi:DNA-binding MarR family transcriptional regulator
MHGSARDAVSLATRVLVGVAARSLPATAETLPQWRALILLDGNDDTRVNVLATHLGIDPSTCTRLCDRLVGKGLIERQWSNDRRREVLLRLTAVGSSLISEALARRRRGDRPPPGSPFGARARAVDAAPYPLIAAAEEVPDDAWALGWAG